MKKLVVVSIFLAAFITTTQAQEELLYKPFFTFEVFKEHVSRLSIPFFNKVSEFENYEDEGEYEALYLKGDDILLIKIEYREGKAKDMPQYLLDGKDTEFYNISGLGMLIIDLPDINSILTISSNKIKKKMNLKRLHAKPVFFN